MDNIERLQRRFNTQKPKTYLVWIQVETLPDRKLNRTTASAHT